MFAAFMREVDKFNRQKERTTFLPLLEFDEIIVIVARGYAFAFNL